MWRLRRLSALAGSEGCPRRTFKYKFSGQCPETWPLSDTSSPPWRWAPSRGRAANCNHREQHNINPPTILICRLGMVQSSVLSRPGCWSLCLPLNYCWINNQRRLCPCPSVPCLTSQCPHSSHQRIFTVMNNEYTTSWQGSRNLC